MRRLPVILASATLFLAGCREDKPAQASAKASPPQPRPVQVVTAKLEKMARAIEATGTLVAREQVALALKVTGRISEINVDLGDRVKKGDVIARIDPTDLRINVEQATAALAQARTRLGLAPDSSDEKVVPERAPAVRQANAALIEARLRFERAKQLFQQSLIAQSELDNASASFQIAESRYQDAIEEIRNREAVLAQRRSELEMARQQLAYAVLYAPIDGAIVERTASAGQYAAAGSPVATVVAIHPLRLRLPVPERQAVHVRIGQQVRVHAGQEGGLQFGRVTRLSPAIDETNRTLLVEAEVPNEQGRFRPGTFVRAEIIDQAAESALMLPESALVTFAGIEKVFIVENGKSVEKQVRSGFRDTGRVEIIEGIQPGDTVIVAPGNMVGGTPVNVRAR